MPGLPVPIVDDIEWIRLQETIRHEKVLSPDKFNEGKKGVMTHKMSDWFKENEDEAD